MTTTRSLLITVLPRATQTDVATLADKPAGRLAPAPTWATATTTATGQEQN
ncbi:hypothetical protein OG285_00995 [Streptomyces sp. NBC_01471]|uniref:hypothetical protein n=1 Tax=Streptomyces sp. NBC_01471 TaxID=2903879 RepID=UPI00324D3E39